jgi:putative nucleotidyltransferase with HDIG domain
MTSALGGEHLMQRAKRVFFDNFELVLVIVLTVAAAYTVLLASNKLAFLNFFYIPVLLAAFFLGRRRGVLASVVAVLLITVFAVINPDLFANNAVEAPALNLFLWGAFLIVTAYVVGTLYDLNSRANTDLKQAYEGILEIVAKFIDAVDGYTQEHSVRVARLACAIAKEMGLDSESCETVRVAGLLHDIGKLDINLDVLNKASALTPMEWNHMMSHTSKGTALIEPMGGLLRDVLPVVQYHHEYFDGTGYYGAGEEEIPLGARILAVADSYDAMITDRPYRTGRTPREAKNEIQLRAKQQYDPRVVDAFLLVMRNEVQSD